MRYISFQENKNTTLRIKADDIVATYEQNDDIFTVIEIYVKGNHKFIVANTEDNRNAIKWLWKG